MLTLSGVLFGVAIWFIVRFILVGLYTVDQNERAVKTILGRAERVSIDKTTLDHPIADNIMPDETRYVYPQVRVIPPGGPYFKMPWEKVHKVSIATQTMNMALDLEDPTANHGGKMLEAVTKDQLNTGMTGQIRYRVSESNLYAFLFGIKYPVVHVMAYFVSVLRQKIANFEARQQATAGAPVTGAEAAGISINDLRKNLTDLNEYMDRECESTAARYGVILDASLITGIDPPQEVESALAAINTAHNQVSSDISVAQAAADQKIVQSRRAVEIETLRTQAEVAPLRALAAELTELKRQGSHVLGVYLRNVRLTLFGKAEQAYLEVGK